MAKATPTKNRIAQMDLEETPETKGRNLTVKLFNDNDSNIEDEDEANATGTVPKEDPTPAMLRSVRYGAAAMHVGHLDPQWNRDDPSAAANRVIDMKHVRELAESMKSSLRRTDNKDRLCVSMSHQQLREAAWATVQINHNINSNDYNQLGQEERERWIAVLKKGTDQLLDRVRKAGSKEFDSLAAYPRLSFPTGNPEWKAPILNRGQHRQGAMRHNIRDLDEIDLTGETLEEVGWGVDIILDDEKLTPDILTAIRLNKTEIYKANSNGDMYMIAWSKLLNMEPNERPRGHRLQDYLHHDIGVSIGLAARFKTVMENPTVGPWACEVNRFVWGREEFQIDHWNSLCTTKVPETINRSMGVVYDRMQNCFQNVMHAVSKDELQMICAVPIPRAGEALRHLRTLFFPTATDTKYGLKSYSVDELSNVPLRTADPLSQWTMLKSLGVNHLTYRRPGFLQGASDKQYLDIASWLIRHSTLRIYSYKTVFKEIRVAAIFSPVLEHAIFWANPDFSPPYRTAAVYKGANFEDVAAEAYVKKSMEYSENDSEEKSRARDKEVEIMMDTYFHALRADIRNNITEWNKIPDKDLRLSYEPNVQKFKRTPTKGERQEYRSRFFKSRGWNEVLKITASHFGIDKFTGLMHPFRKEGVVENLEWEASGLKATLQEKFARMKRHASVLPLLSQCGLHIEVGHAAACMLLHAELDTLRQKIKRNENRLEAKETGAALQDEDIEGSPLANDDVPKAQDLMVELTNELKALGAPPTMAPDDFDKRNSEKSDYLKLLRATNSRQARAEAEKADKESDEEWEKHKPKNMQEKSAKIKVAGHRGSKRGLEDPAADDDDDDDEEDGEAEYEPPKKKSRRGEGKDGGRKDDGRKGEGKKDEGKRSEGGKGGGKKDEGKKSERKEGEGKKSERKEGEGKKGEGKKGHGKKGGEGKEK